MPKRSKSKTKAKAKAKTPARAKSRSSSKKTPGAGGARPSFYSIAVVVSDRANSVEWYTKKLGLDLVAADDHWQAVGRKGSGGMIHLCRVHDWDEKGELEPGNSGIALTLPGDFVESCQALMARGVEFTSPPEKYDWGWGATIRDPDGNEIYLTPE